MEFQHLRVHCATLILIQGRIHNLHTCCCMYYCGKVSPMASNGSIPTLGEDVPEDNLARLIRRKTPSYRVPMNTGGYCVCIGCCAVCMNVCTDEAVD